MLTILKDKRLVSVGEATHGTKEFAQIKCRLFKFLVEQMGFTVFALEADFSAELAVNRYVQGIDTDAKKALQGLRFFHCVNDETLQLVYWMREYNDKQTDKKRKVKFYGFDFGFPDMGLRELSRIMARADTNMAKQVAQVKPVEYAPLIGRYIEMADIKMIQELVTSGLNKFDSFQTDQSLAMQLIEVLQQYYRTTTKRDSLYDRDADMKRNIDWILNSEGENTKIMLWSHNDHARYGTFESRWGGTFNSMGLELKEKYGTELYTIAFDFNKGKFYANLISRNREKKLTVFEVGEAPAGTLAWQLSKVDKNAFFLDFGELKDNPAIQAWLGQRSKVRYLGGALFEADDCFRDLNCFYATYKLSCAFNGLFFVNDTHEITPLKK